ncbi:hypothetical protein [Paenibacillus thiaminolyticus]|uniref:Helix-turn-helix domain-containing protein n=1 Tax=Paenibacillus thiaminolyticus TaxID=49283 RepID=A0A3A3GAA2_PANTH|nr:hypothetical protein [Paenibacillus thiaminolyticus]RJG15189.1 hypothetical protein DQX05_29885 [Paenibacillus thiaminolyticus]
MTKAEMKKGLVVEKIIDRRMTNREGSVALGLSERQVIRLKKKYQSEKEAQESGKTDSPRPPQ